MVNTLPSLIDKQDGFEIVRDQIGAIILAETLAQQALAPAAMPPQSPADYALKVYSEAFNPWESQRENASDLTPVVNVWYDNGSFPMARGNRVEKQIHEAIFNIDCYGFARAKTDGATGHEPGDVAAALEAQRALRLVRNMLMAGHNTYLQLRGLVAGRWPQSITVFQQSIDTAKAPQVVAARLAFRVDFMELAPQLSYGILDFIHIDVNRAEDGSLYFDADYDYTTP